MSAPCVISAGTVIEDFSAFSSWVKDSQLLSTYRHWRCLDDPTKVGVCTVHTATASPTVGYITRTTGLALDLSDMVSLRLDFAAGLSSDQYGGTEYITVDISSVTDFSKRMSFATTAYCAATFDGERLLMKAGDFTAVGGESWANTMVAIRIGVNLANYSYGCNGGHYKYFDKIVKNPQTSGLVMIAFDTSYKADSDVFMDALADNGLTSKAHSLLFDYDNIGDAPYNTYAQLLAIEAAGLQMYPSHTPWLLYAPTNANRPVPPYPAQDDDYANAVDLTALHLLTAAQNAEVQRRIKVIHDFYGFPWRSDLFLPHGGSFYGATGRQFFREAGFRAAVARADWSATSKGPHYMTLPVAGNHVVAWYLASGGGATNAHVIDAIDEVCEGNGRYLYLHFGRTDSTAEWTEADMRTELAYLKTKQDAGLLTVVTPAEFLALAMQPVDITLNDRATITITSPSAPADIRIVAGDEIDQPFVLSGHDLTGCLATFRVASTAGAHLFERASGGAGIIFTDAAAGELTVSLEATDTSDLSGWYRWQLRTTQGDGAEVVTALGRLYVAGAIT